MRSNTFVFGEQITSGPCVNATLEVTVDPETRALTWVWFVSSREAARGTLTAERSVPTKAEQQRNGSVHVREAWSGSGWIVSFRGTTDLASAKKKLDDDSPNVCLKLPKGTTYRLRTGPMIQGTIHVACRPAAGGDVVDVPLHPRRLMDGEIFLVPEADSTWTFWREKGIGKLEMSIEHADAAEVARTKDAVVLTGMKSATH